VVVVGADSHKRTHTVVAVKDVGRRLDEKTVAATSEGHLLLVQWAAQWPEVTFALEDCRHLTRRLERDLLCAGHRVGETAGAHRFRNKDAYARFTGTAPIPVWSGTSNGKVRLNRGGNRTLNTALHMIAVTQSRGYGSGRAYLDKLTAPGKGRTEAVRLLRRRLSDTVSSALRIDERRHATVSDNTTSEQPATAA
jgi:transposase